MTTLIIPTDLKRWNKKEQVLYKMFVLILFPKWIYWERKKNNYLQKIFFFYFIHISIAQSELSFTPQQKNRKKTYKLPTKDNFSFWIWFILKYQKSLKLAFKASFWEQIYYLNMPWGVEVWNPLRLYCIKNTAIKC